MELFCKKYDMKKMTVGGGRIILGLFGFGMLWLRLGQEPTTSYCTTFFPSFWAPVFLGVFGFGNSIIGYFLTPRIQSVLGTKAIYVLCSTLSSISLGSIAVTLWLEEKYGSSWGIIISYIANYTLMAICNSVGLCSHVRYRNAAKVYKTDVESGNQVEFKVDNCFFVQYYSGQVGGNLCVLLLEIAFHLKKSLVMLIITGLNLLSLPIFLFFMKDLPKTEQLNKETYYANLKVVRKDPRTKKANIFFCAYFLLNSYSTAVFTKFFPERWREVFVGLSWVLCNGAGAIISFFFGWLKNKTFKGLCYAVNIINALMIVSLILCSIIGADSTFGLVLPVVSMVLQGLGAAASDMMGFHLVDLFAEASRKTDSPLDVTAMTQHCRLFSNGVFACVSLTSIWGNDYPFIYVLVIVAVSCASSLVMMDLLAGKNVQEEEVEIEIEMEAETGAELEVEVETEAEAEALMEVEVGLEIEVAEDAEEKTVVLCVNEDAASIDVAPSTPEISTRVVDGVEPTNVGSSPLPVAIPSHVTASSPTPDGPPEAAASSPVALAAPGALAPAGPAGMCEWHESNAGPNSARNRLRRDIGHF